MVQMQLKQKGKNRKLKIAKVRTKWESNILVADLFLTSGYVKAYNPSDDLIVRIPENETEGELWSYEI